MEPYAIYDEYKTIKKTQRELSDKYPVEANYGSRCSLWQCGLRDGSVSKELFEAARRYYGKLWSYVGD